MKLSATDYETLLRAADIADAQRELLQRSKRRSAQARSTTSTAILAALAALALASLLTLTSMA
jgi:hypothetical protein